MTNVSSCARRVKTVPRFCESHALSTRLPHLIKNETQNKKPSMGVVGKFLFISLCHN